MSDLLDRAFPGGDDEKGATYVAYSDGVSSGARPQPEMVQEPNQVSPYSDDEWDAMPWGYWP